MTLDEQRKRIFELESALGKCIGVSEKLLSQNRLLADSRYELEMSLTVTLSQLKQYHHTKEPMYLMSAIDTAKRGLNHERTKQREQPKEHQPSQSNEPMD